MDLSQLLENTIKKQGALPCFSFSGAFQSLDKKYFGRDVVNNVRIILSERRSISLYARSCVMRNDTQLPYIYHTSTILHDINIMPWQDIDVIKMIMDS